MTNDATATMLDVFDGTLSELEICEPGWAYAGRLTDNTGQSWRFVYRSTAVKTNSQLHQRVLAWLDGAEPVGDVGIYDDSEMMYGTGELTLWEP